MCLSSIAAFPRTPNAAIVPSSETHLAENMPAFVAHFRDIAAVLFK